LGVLSAMVGAVQYYICTTQEPSSCDRFAPQEQFVALALFILQIFAICAHWSRVHTAHAADCHVPYSVACDETGASQRQLQASVDACECRGG
jgi:hypothetical protein